MCGILGTITTNGRHVDLAELDRLRDVLAHRGPDGRGTWISPDGRVGLAHRRLAIIDTSAAADQPMLRDDADLVITYNGEIYNYRELRNELAALGHTFQTGSDTEVILAAFHQWGEDCVTRFNGMWAFAIWDARARRLFCSRDRLGIKPLYYYSDRGTFLFASEMKALLASGRVPRQVDGSAVYDYVNFSRKDHTCGTFVEDVRAVPAGHNLTLDADGRLTVRRYWDLQVELTAKPLVPTSRAEAAERLLELLRDAVRLHLRADVLCGICLSGGLDSSTIAVLAAELFREGRLDAAVVKDHLRCYTAHYPGEPIDESRYAKEIIQATGARAAWVVPSGERLFERLDDLIYYLDEPFVSTSMFAQWTVIERAAQDGVKVLLDGQGGDEVFGGYPHYCGVYLTHLLSEGRLATAFHEGWLLRRSATRRPWRTAAAQFSRLLYSHFPRAVRAPIRSRFRRIGRFIRPEFLDTSSDRDEEIGARPSRINLQRRLYDDTVSTNLPSLLRYEDRIAMAFGIEARVPLLDYRIVEFLFSLPASMKVHDGWTKWVLREALKGRLPEDVRLRRDKLGFPTPQIRWLTGRMQWLRELFGSSDFRAGAYLDGRRIASELPALLTTDKGSREVWRWLCLELWMRKFQMSARI